MEVRPNATISGSRSATAIRMKRYGIPQHTLSVMKSTHPRRVTTHYPTVCLGKRRRSRGSRSVQRGSEQNLIGGSLTNLQVSDLGHLQGGSATRSHLLVRRRRPILDLLSLT